MNQKSEVKQIGRIYREEVLSAQEREHSELLEKIGLNIHFKLSMIIEELEFLKQKLIELEERITIIEAEVGLLPIPEMVFEELPMREVLRRVEEFVRKRPGCLTDEVAEALGIDPILVVEALHILEKRGRLRSEPP